MVGSLYEMRPFGVAVKAMIPGGTKTNFQTPLNDVTGCEKAAENQRKSPAGRSCGVPEPEEAASVIWAGRPTGKTSCAIRPTAYAETVTTQYISMGMEEFKEYFYKRLFE